MVSVNGPARLRIKRPAPSNKSAIPEAFIGLPLASKRPITPTSGTAAATLMPHLVPLAPGYVGDLGGIYSGRTAPCHVTGAFRSMPEPRQLLRQMTNGRFGWHHIAKSLRWKPKCTCQFRQ